MMNFACLNLYGFEFCKFVCFCLSPQHVESRCSIAQYVKYHDRSKTRHGFEETMENNHSPNQSDSEVTD